MCSAYSVQKPELGDLCTTTGGSRSTVVAAGCDAVGGACALAGSAKRTQRARRQRRKLCGCMVVEGRGTGGLCQRSPAAGYATRWMRTRRWDRTEAVAVRTQEIHASA